jgi:hypothetical protein
MYCGVHNMFRLEHNVETGEIKQIDLTAGEIKEIEKLQKAAAIENAKEQAEIEAKQIAKAAILDRIGLTADELKTILG